VDSTSHSHVLLETLALPAHAEPGVNAFRRLGVSRRQAIRHGKSRKGYWHMAKTIASGVGMTNKWLQEQGLVSLKSLWASLAPR
jgi:hypothetical protein